MVSHFFFENIDFYRLYMPNDPLSMLPMGKHMVFLSRNDSNWQFDSFQRVRRVNKGSWTKKNHRLDPRIPEIAARLGEINLLNKFGGEFSILLLLKVNHLFDIFRFRAAKRKPRHSSERITDETDPVRVDRIP